MCINVRWRSNSILNDFRYWKLNGGLNCFYFPQTKGQVHKHAVIYVNGF